VAELIILGMPLSEEEALPAKTISALKDSHWVIAERRQVALPRLKAAGASPESIFFLDPFRERELKELKENLTLLAATEKKVALFSDMGMPLLFDPGKDILEHCQKVGFSIHSVPGPTSWGTACALSGYLPPFLIVGFLSQKTEIRTEELIRLKKEKAHLVLMETPYRFEPLLEQCTKVLGAKRDAFLAWEIGMPQEELIWGSLSQIRSESAKRGLKKGEFILIIKGDK
jgi:16S rRNA (cytidine1402-2'-O)-methyltransferase